MSKNANTMKTKLLLIILMLPLFSAKCKKGDDDCHYTITIKNEGVEKVIYSTVLYHDNRTKCFLTKNAELNPSESFEQRIRICREDRLKHQNFEFYIVDNDGFSEGGFYDCDSIEYRNTILKHYVITQADLEQLRANNFIITYP